MKDKSEEKIIDEFVGLKSDIHKSDSDIKWEELKAKNIKWEHTKSTKYRYCVLMIKDLF